MLLKHRLRANRRWLIIAGVVVVLVGAGIGVWRITRPQPAPAFRAVAVTTATLRQTVSSSGTIEPAQQENLNFAVSGQVTAVNVAVGQQVSSGQALATLNSASLSASVADAKATLSSDQARLSSDRSANASSAQINADQAAVTAAQNQVNNAQNALNEATLSAPISGTVAAVNLTTGQQVSGGNSSSGTSSSSSGTSSGSSGGGSTGGGQSAGGGQSGGSSGGGSTGGGQSAGGGASGGGASSGGGQTGGGTSGAQSGGGSSSSSAGSSAQIVVISTGSYIVNASVDDTEVGQVQTGDQAVITPNGSATPVYGLVTSVGMLATSSSSVPTYPVTISVTGSPPGLFAGAGAQVDIVVKQLTDVPVVPSAAVHFTNGSPSVLVVSNGKEVTRSITVGMVSGGQTQILGGLSEGDQVLVPNTARGGAGAGGRTGGGGLGGGGLGGAGGGRGFGGGGFGGGGGGGGGGRGAGGG